jgi:hypothetical protein
MNDSKPLSVVKYLSTFLVFGTIALVFNQCDTPAKQYLRKQAAIDKAELHASWIKRGLE